MVPDFTPELDTVALIFDVRYECKVPEIFLRSEANLRVYGTYVSLFPQIDNDLFKRLTHTALPIERMAEIRSDGGAVLLLNIEDVENVYKSIDNHLKHWKYRLEYESWNKLEAPISDLRKLEALAQDIYDTLRKGYVNIETDKRHRALDLLRLSIGGELGKIVGMSEKLSGAHYFERSQIVPTISKLGVLR